MPLSRVKMHFSLNSGKILPAGQEMQRSWMLPLCVSEKLYCFCCRLFAACVTDTTFKIKFDWVSDVVETKPRKYLIMTRTKSTYNALENLKKKKNK